MTWGKYVLMRHSFAPLCTENGGPDFTLNSTSTGRQATVGREPFARDSRRTRNSGNDVGHQLYVNFCADQVTNVIQLCTALVTAGSAKARPSGFAQVYRCRLAA